jgi:uncharacterized protein YbjQ (UPF0145 family)
MKNCKHKDSFLLQIISTNKVYVWLMPLSIIFNLQKTTVMILTTTPQIEGRKILDYKGVVFGETIIGANVFKDFFAAIRDVVGGRSGTYERVLQEAREIAMNEMSARAQQMGANAVVGIDVDYEVIGNSGSMLMVSVSGTAVNI